MQFKLLTLALFASFFATGFAVTVYPGLTEAESATIEPIVQKLGIQQPTKEQVSCIAKTVKKYMDIPLDGTPLSPEIATVLIPQVEILYRICLLDPSRFE
ncbi:hypothetical protein RMATCC62417_12421 [Rhizopus microsporus]|nr:hypothetical protein RMATCC62417_12421 [Rhizopus microsporus]